MSHGTMIWALVTLTLLAVLTFASTNLPALGHNPASALAPSIEATHRALVLERNLHTDLKHRFAHSVEAFAPLLALLVVTLVVLDSLEDRFGRSSESKLHDSEYQPALIRSAVEADEWPREFELDADRDGWVQVASNPQISRYGGN